MKLKHHFLITKFIFVNVLFSYSQSSIEFPKSNATWQEGYYLSASQIIPERRVLCGDTTINNQVYAKIFSIIFNNQGIESERVYQGGIRGEVDQVFWVKKDESTEIVLYDWSLESTETIEVETITGTQNTLTAKSNEYITTSDGVLRRVIVFKAVGNNEEEVWIEGIGSNFGILARGVDLNVSPDYRPFLNCYRFENEIIYSPTNPPLSCNYIFNENCVLTSSKVLKKREINVLVFPNPFSQKIGITIVGFEELKNPLLKIMNGQGRLIKTMYLHNRESAILFETIMSKGLYLIEISDDLNKIKFRKKLICN